MLGWGKLAWFSGLLSRWNSKTSTRLERLSIVHTESLCGDGVCPRGRKNLSSSLPTFLKYVQIQHAYG